MSKHSAAQLAHLKSEVLTANADTRAAALAALTAVGGEDVFAFYLSLLDSADQWLRNAIAIELKRLGDARAVESLFCAALEPTNIGANGTLMYVLRSFDCRQYLPQLFEIILHHGYEALLMAVWIVDEQEFTPDAAMRRDLRAAVAQARQHPSPALLEFGIEELAELADAVLAD
ncbi:HEAT repeat domain-containing protein [Hymenobacter sp. CRA2]|uniref:HEAT repeat domain-containing protein n=1 Tax=Hymenobacter sp. CRA2 TaxID=1955620 RepID=UPI00098F3849|nr:HEAT repeat domain-containing protein [Hymenobacter sp. CRA2]OON66869.1 hypothetical protein B0919_21150 [Hymenobacter sp. CRA2]